MNNIVNLIQKDYSTLSFKSNNNVYVLENMVNFMNVVINTGVSNSLISFVDGDDFRSSLGIDPELPIEDITAEVCLEGFGSWLVSAFKKVWDFIVGVFKAIGKWFLKIWDKIFNGGRKTREAEEAKQKEEQEKREKELEKRIDGLIEDTRKSANEKAEQNEQFKKELENRRNKLNEIIDKRTKLNEEEKEALKNGVEKGHNRTKEIIDKAKKRKAIITERIISRITPKGIQEFGKCIKEIMNNMISTVDFIRASFGTVLRASTDEQREKIDIYEIKGRFKYALKTVADLNTKLATIMRTKYDDEYDTYMALYHAASDNYTSMSNMFKSLSEKTNDTISSLTSDQDRFIKKIESIDETESDSHKQYKSNLMAILKEIQVLVGQYQHIISSSISSQIGHYEKYVQKTFDDAMQSDEILVI